MKWVKGRQNPEDGEYYKCLLFTVFGILDVYLLKFTPYVEIPVHIDPIPSGVHMRMNINLCGRNTLFVKRSTWVCSRRLISCFESGTLQHSFKNGKSTSYQLSIGWKRNK